MKQDTIKTVLTVIVLVLAFGVAMSLLRWLINILLPIAIVIVAAYIVYKFVNRSKY